MSKYAIIIAIAIFVIYIIVKSFLYKGKIKRAYREKAWDSLPRLIFFKNAVFGVVIPGLYYRDSLKFVVESGRLFSEKSAAVIEICEKKGYGGEYAQQYLILRELIWGNVLPQKLIEAKQTPFSRSLLACARGDSGAFIDEINAHPPKDDNLRTLGAVLARKLGYSLIPIDDGMRASVYAELLKEETI